MGREWAGVGKQQVGWVACEARMQVRQSKRAQQQQWVAAKAAAVAQLSAAATPTAVVVQRATVQARVLGPLQHMQQHSPYHAAAPTMQQQHSTHLPRRLPSPMPKVMKKSKLSRCR